MELLLLLKQRIHIFNPNSLITRLQTIIYIIKNGLEDVFRYIRDEKLPIYCDIELEYPVKPWSNAVKEVGTCIKYARQILM